MSEAQLKKVLAENEMLKVQLERMPKLIKTSDASKEYVLTLVTCDHDAFLLYYRYTVVFLLRYLINHVGSKISAKRHRNR